MLSHSTKNIKTSISLIVHPFPWQKIFSFFLFTVIFSLSVAFVFPGSPWNLLRSSSFVFELIRLSIHGPCVVAICFLFYWERTFVNGVTAFILDKPIHRKGPYIFQRSCFLEAFSQEVKILVSMGSMGFIILKCPPLLNVCKFFVKCHSKCSEEYVPLAFF